MTRKRYTAEDVAAILMADKDSLDVDLESSFESDVSSAEEDLYQPIIPESGSDAVYVSGSSSK